RPLRARHVRGQRAPGAAAGRGRRHLRHRPHRDQGLIADEIVKKQRDDGSWEFFLNLRRPPINESQTTDAVWIILALQGEMGRDGSASQRVALKKATDWLAGAKLSDDLQDKVLKLLLAIRAG